MTSVDLPDPLTPVTAMNVPSGNATSMFLRLLARAPRTTISPRVGGRRTAGIVNALQPGEVLPGQRLAWRRQQLLRPPLEHHVAAVFAGARPEVDQVVGRANRLFVVLDDEHGVAEIAQLAERAEQPPVVALMQANRRLVEHVEHAGELRANLRGEPDALPFSARERRGAAAEREIADADIDEKAKPIADLAQRRARRPDARDR